MDQLKWKEARIFADEEETIHSLENKPHNQARQELNQHWRWEAL